MSPDQIVPGRKVRVNRANWTKPSNDTMVVEAFPIRGLYNDFACCRLGRTRLYFRPEELDSAEAIS